MQMESGFLFLGRRGCPCAATDLFRYFSVKNPMYKLVPGLLLLLACSPQHYKSNMHAAFPHPTPAQQVWHDTEFYLFCHFGPNTFTNVEWGHGTEPEDVFNPTHLDCDQWCKVALAAGARGIVITAKHHDGFCLWPSAYSKHTVRESKWRNGKGDVLRELSEACKRHGLKFGVYLSPWDRNHPLYGTPAYNDLYANTLTELLTNYGELFEIWWDGANGEGPNGKSQVYDFHRFEQIAARLQPNAVVFSDIGPGCRWVGNERGMIETETNWCTLDTTGFKRGLGAPPNDTLNRGNENGAHWIPAECDVSIRPGWFYHPEEDDKVKNMGQLWDIYLHSVGRGANLILNVPPDRAGRIHPQDSLALTAFGEKIRNAWRANLASGKPVFYDNKVHPVKTLTAVQSNKKGPAPGAWQIVLDLQQPTPFNTIRLEEDLSFGQRVQNFSIEVLENGQWREITRSTTIGSRKICSFPTVEAQQIRVKILGAKSIPTLRRISIFRIDQ